MRAYERLLKYVKIMSPSDEKSTTVPSTPYLMEIAKVICEDMKEMGLKDARVSDYGYVYGSIPATEGYEDRVALRFISHMDTVADFADRPVNPRIVENYDGSDIVLGDSGRVIEVSKYPHLKGLIGKTIITSDGNTILGSDDKAGVSIILTMAEEIMKGDIPHGKICIGFTPDEEIGRGPDYFDIKGFGADFAFTVDGGKENEVEYENFNAATVILEAKGYSVHPGEAKDRMINAADAIARCAAELPFDETPRTTEGRQGYFHLIGITGAVEEAQAVIIIRDHDLAKFEAKKTVVQEAADKINDFFGSEVIKVTVKDSYRNMMEIIKKNFHLIENAYKAVRMCGLEPESMPVRGGTDGATISANGLPCPNLGMGGYAFHGPFEHCCVEGMDTSVEIVKNLIRIYSEKKPEDFR